MKSAVAVIAVASVLASGCGSSGGSSNEVVVLAASSLTNVFEDGHFGYFSLTGDGPNADVRFSYAGSNALVAQLRDGAHADVLITASRSTMDAAIANGSVAGQPALLARNRLVLAVADTNPADISSLDDLADPANVIGLCSPQVPCGALAATALESLGVVASPDTLESNVKALANKISLGEIDAGLIYSTDALALNLQTVEAPGLDRFATEYLIAAVAQHPAPIVILMLGSVTSGGPLTKSLTDSGFEVP